jgi:hypothetical protein
MMAPWRGFVDLLIAWYLQAPLQPEPVSPELVLVDPELARRERARLVERARLEAMAGVATFRRDVEIQPAQAGYAGPPKAAWRDVADFSRRRLLPAVLMLSLLVNGLLVAHFVARTGNQPSDKQDRVANRVVTLGPSSSTGPTTQSTSVVADTSAYSTSPAAVTAPKTLVERRLAALIISAPARKLPRQFVDATTGLVKNNVQVVCRRRTTRSFLCVVRPPSGAPKEGLYVRYRTGPNSHGVFTWYGYTEGVSIRTK